MKLKKKTNRNVFSEGLDAYQLHPYIREEYEDFGSTTELDDDMDNFGDIEVPHGDSNGASSMLISAINGEWETIEEYNSIVATLRDLDSEKYDQIISIIQDIVNEEHVHVGQLQTALSLLSNSASLIHKGEKEAEGQINSTDEYNPDNESLMEADLTVGQDEEETEKKKNLKRIR